VLKLMWKESEKNRIKPKKITEGKISVDNSVNLGALRFLPMRRAELLRIKHRRIKLHIRLHV
jgi:hypothetical protein